MPTREPTNPLEIRDPAFAEKYSKHQDRVVNCLLKMREEGHVLAEYIVVDRYKKLKSGWLFITEIWHKPTGKIYSIYN